MHCTVSKHSAVDTAEIKTGSLPQGSPIQMPKGVESTGLIRAISHYNAGVIESTWSSVISVIKET